MAWYYTTLLIVEYVIWWGVLAVGWKRADTGDRLLGAFILVVGQHCALGYLLGSIGSFEPWAVAYFHEMLLLLVLLLVWVYWGNILPALRADVGQAGVRVWELLKKPAVVIVACVAASGVGLLVYYALNMPPMSYDGWGYHLPKAVLLARTGWIQPWWWNAEAGEFMRGFRGYDDLTRAGGFLTWWTDFYPANGSVLMAYPLLFGASLRVACLTQVVFAVMMVLSVYRIVRRVVGAGVEWSALVGLGVLCLWTVLGQTWYALADVMSASLLWAGYALVMVPYYRYGWRNPLVYRGFPAGVGVDWHTDEMETWTYIPFILSGLAAGLAVGTKLAAGYWALGIFGLAIYKAVKR